MAHVNLGDREDIFITHFIIIIKSEVLTFPIIVIDFRGCVPDVADAAYAVGSCNKLPEVVSKQWKSQE